MICGDTLKSSFAGCPAVYHVATVLPVLPTFTTVINNVYVACVVVVCSQFQKSLIKYLSSNGPKKLVH